MTLLPALMNNQPVINFDILEKLKKLAITSSTLEAGGGGGGGPSGHAPAATYLLKSLVT